MEGSEIAKEEKIKEEKPSFRCVQSQEGWYFVRAEDERYGPFVQVTAHDFESWREPEKTLSAKEVDELLAPLIRHESIDTPELVAA